MLKEASVALTSQSVVDALEALGTRRPLPKPITVDHGTEFTSKALDEWAYRRGVVLNFIRSGKPVEIAFIERFNGRLRAARRWEVARSFGSRRWAEAEPRVPNAMLRDAVRTAPFWLLVVALLSINVPGSGIVSQLAPLVGDKGIPQHAAAFVLSIYAVGLLVGRLVTGFALDRLPAWVVGTVMTFLPAVGVAGLLVPSPSFVLAATVVCLIGMPQASEIDLIAHFVSRCFGVTHYGAIYGAIAIAGALSTAVALVFFGRVHDLTGSYDAALIVGGLAFCIGAIAFASIRPARHG